jgi:hypothetical protein
MGKASTNKKVARAASTGGGRTARGARPWGWYASMAVVALLGSFVIVSSRNDRQAASNPVRSERPRPPAPSKDFQGDHWHAAYGIYTCDSFVPPIQSDADPLGIHTHNDGVIHIHPFTRAASGRKATLDVFARAVGATFEEDRLEVPGGKTYTDGDKCGDKKGTVRVFLNGDERRGDPGNIRLRDRDLLVVAFAPPDAEVPKTPPSAGELDQLTDVPGATTTTSAAPGGDDGTTPPPSGETETPASTAPPPTGEPGTTVPTTAPAGGEPGTTVPTSSP